MLGPFLTPYREKKLQELWNTSSPRKRLDLILKHNEVFWALELITEAELKVAEATSVSNQNYVLSREEQPFFSHLYLKKPFAQQIHSQKLKAALNAVFKKGSTKSRWLPFLSVRQAEG